MERQSARVFTPNSLWKLGRQVIWRQKPEYVTGEGTLRVGNWVRTARARKDSGTLEVLENVGAFRPPACRRHPKLAGHLNIASIRQMRTLRLCSHNGFPREPQLGLRKIGNPLQLPRSTSSLYHFSMGSLHEHSRSSSPSPHVFPSSQRHLTPSPGLSSFLDEKKNSGCTKRRLDSNGRNRRDIH